MKTRLKKFARGNWFGLALPGCVVWIAACVVFG